MSHKNDKGFMGKNEALDKMRKKTKAPKQKGWKGC